MQKLHIYLTVVGGELLRCECVSNNMGQWESVTMMSDMSWYTPRCKSDTSQTSYQRMIYVQCSQHLLNKVHTQSFSHVDMQKVFTFIYIKKFHNNNL